jgi:Tol biopolymer transport system component
VAIGCLEPRWKTLYANRLEVSFTDADIYAIDILSRNATNLTSHQGEALNTASSISPDGKTRLITSDAKSGYQNVALLDIASRKVPWVTDTKWEASAGDFSPDGKQFTYAINADGRSDVYLGDTATTKSDKIPIGSGANGFAAYPSSFSGGRLLLSHESSVEPADFWVYDLASRKPRQLTYSVIASLNSAPGRHRNS